MTFASDKKHRHSKYSWRRTQRYYGVVDRVSERGFFLVSNYPYTKQPLETPNFIGGPQTLQFFYVVLNGVLKVNRIFTYDNAPTLMEKVVIGYSKINEDTLC